MKGPPPFWEKNHVKCMVGPIFTAGFNLLLFKIGIYNQDGLGAHQEIHTLRERLTVISE